MFKDIQGHRFWYQSKAICDLLLLVINTDLHTCYLAPFPRYCRLLVKFALSTAGGTSFL